MALQLEEVLQLEEILQLEEVLQLEHKEVKILQYLTQAKVDDF